MNLYLQEYHEVSYQKTANELIVSICVHLKTEILVISDQNIQGSCSHNRKEICSDYNKTNNSFCLFWKYYIAIEKGASL